MSPKHTRPDRLKTGPWFAVWQRTSLALVIALLLTGCAGYGTFHVNPKQPNVVSLDPQDWYTLYTNGAPLHPTPDLVGAWSLKIPNSPGHLNYVETPFNATVPLHSITVVFEIASSSPEYVVVDNTDHPPATCRLMIEVKNDDYTDPNGRWWADASTYNLGSQDDQILTFTVPLTPSFWTNVQGQRDAAAFAAALSNLGAVGLTFGGQYFAGHGVAISSGSAKYVLVDYGVE